MARLNPRRSLLATVLATFALFGAMITPAAAVTNGSLDGDAHPYVGLMVASVGGVPKWRCSGTLISPTVYLTAGHCTFGADHVELWFDSDMQTDAAAKGYPFTGQVSGTPYTHPQYDDNAFFLYDLGVVVLDAPVSMSDYGALPALDSLDTLKPGPRASFTSVGYGLQGAFPDAASWKDSALKLRMVAYPQLLQINVPGFTGDGSLLLSNNAKTGGTCFGDSGGPNFLGDSHIVAAVTSFGISPTCGGTGGVYRVDRSDDLDWLATFFE